MVNMKLFVILICVVLFSIIEAYNTTKNGSKKLKNIDQQSTRRIVGGNFAQRGQFPFLASLRLKDAHFCGGAVLGSRWILTAAHCFDSTIQYVGIAYVIIGNLRLAERGQRKEIEGLIPHQSYDENTFTNDICLVRVTPHIVFSNSIQPIGIMKQPPATGTWITIIGWGDTVYEGDLSPDLKYAFLQVLPNWQCKRMFKKYVSDTLGCGLGAPGEGTCNGDSGGPLIQDGKMVGVSSWGLRCAAGYPDTFTKLYLYLDWVRANTGMNVGV